MFIYKQIMELFNLKGGRRSEKVQRRVGSRAKD